MIKLPKLTAIFESGRFGGMVQLWLAYIRVSVDLLKELQPIWLTKVNGPWIKNEKLKSWTVLLNKNGWPFLRLHGILKFSFNTSLSIKESPTGWYKKLLTCCFFLISLIALSSWALYSLWLFALYTFYGILWPLKTSHFIVFYIDKYNLDVSA